LFEKMGTANSFALLVSQESDSKLATSKGRPRTRQT